jgi:hypothetical protein
MINFSRLRRTSFSYSMTLSKFDLASYAEAFVWLLESIMN